MKDSMMNVESIRYRNVIVSCRVRCATIAISVYSLIFNANNAYSLSNNLKTVSVFF